MRWTLLTHTLHTTLLNTSITTPSPPLNSTPLHDMTLLYKPSHTTSTLDDDSVFASQHLICLLILCFFYLCFYRRGGGCITPKSGWVRDTLAITLAGRRGIHWIELSGTNTELWMGGRGVSIGRTGLGGPDLFFFRSCICCFFDSSAFTVALATGIWHFPSRYGLCFFLLLWLLDSFFDDI